MKTSDGHIDALDCCFSCARRHDCPDLKRREDSVYEIFEIIQHCSGFDAGDVHPYKIFGS